MPHKKQLASPHTMSWFGKSLDLVKNLRSGFSPQVLQFPDVQVMTTSLLAEGGYSYVYSAREVPAGCQFAVKKVLAQDAETRQVAETESALLMQLSGQPGFVQCYGTMIRELPKSHREYWMLLEYCPNGSLVDLLYRKKKSGEYEKLPCLEEAASIASSRTPPSAAFVYLTHRHMRCP